MKQPLGIVALLYLGGLLLGNFIQPPLPCLFTVSLAVAGSALLLSRVRPFLIWPLVILTAWTNLAWHTAIISPTDLRAVLTNEPKLATVRGTLATQPTVRFYNAEPKSFFETTARLNVTAIGRGTNWQPVTGQIEVITTGILPEDFCAKQEVQVFGVLEPPPGPLAEGLFDFRTFLRRQEIYFRLKAKSSDDWQLAGSSKVSPPLSARFIKWAKPALAIGQTNEDVTLHLEQTLALGDKTFLTDEIAEPFVRASTYHIFAVDGLRMGIIFWIFFKSFRALRVPRTFCGLILIPLIWFYVELTGWPASAIRAAVMLTIVIFGWMLKRPVDPLNSLYAAALIILIWQPHQLFQSGFQLSFCVVFCILLMTPRLDDVVQHLLRADPLRPEELRPRWQRALHFLLRFALGLFSASLAAWIGSIPLVAYYFHIVTPVSTPANMVAVPLCSAVLSCNLSSLLLAGWFPAGAAVFNSIGWHFMECIRVSSQWFANLPHACSYVAMPTIFAIIVYYLILVAVLTGWVFEAKRRAWRIAGLALLAAASCGQWLYETSATRFTVLPLNGGNAVYCDLRGGNDDLLVNCGSSDAVDFIMKPYLRAQGVNSLPCLALTHGDEELIGGFEKLQSLMSIEKVVTSSERFRSPAYRDIIALLEKTPGRREVVNGGDMLGYWSVLNPAATNHFPRADDNALVLRGEFEGVRILLLSDLGRPGQEWLLEHTADLHADIVVAGLPEQNEPLNDTLLDAIKPELIVIADSEMPAARKASRALHSRLEKHGIPVIYTSESGAVKISLRANSWKASGPDGVSLANAPQDRQEISPAHSVKNSAP